MSWTQETFQEAVRKVSERAAVDAAFRSLCVSDIHAAIQQESGIEVPSSFKIGVLDPSANQLNIVIPPVALEEGELQEDELESVAGGVKGTLADGSGEIPRDSVGIIPELPGSGGMIFFGSFPK
ncbi:hypothetical protein GZH47_16865 [Paenibacillus rhizovicinus]|uniref:NHLP leader peptide family natural product n=1 Tax=Paenibacillus rhizovicinus TaxID=2704463 RepID=A0A6C0P3B0_9BACL|nr:hypothetical protein [Paenibacillus rhizovicinus]QHW32313.1 hypothetical protein GZH47_16865 [Paenibacillus rhizovicinus]